MPAQAQQPRMSVPLRVLVSVVFSVGSLGLSVGMYMVLASQRPPLAERETVIRVYNVEVFDAERMDLQEVLSAFGTARADREVPITAQVSGSWKLCVLSGR